MTYVPPDRDAEALDRTRQLDFTPSPVAGDGAPVDPFAAVPPAPPETTEPGPVRDRVAFQFVWEAILLLLTLNALFLVYQRWDEVFGGDITLDALGPELSNLASVVLIASAFGLTLRIGAVNLAVPAMPVLVLGLTSLFVGENPLIGLGYTAGAAAVLAVVFTVLTVVFRVPAWLAGLATLVVMAGSVTALTALADLLGTGEAGTWSDPGGLWLFLAAAVLSVAGGLIGLAPGVRDRFSKVKGAADGTGDRGAASVAALLGGTFLALLLAAAAGFLPAVFGEAETASESVLTGMFGLSADSGIVLTPFVFIVVFLAGTSPWGRRGGVFGTVFAAVAVWALLEVWATLADGYADWTAALYAGLLLLGLFVSFGLDRLGRPKEPAEPEPDPAEPAPFDSPNGTLNPGTGLFEPTLPDANAAK